MKEVEDVDRRRALLDRYGSLLEDIEAIETDDPSAQELDDLLESREVLRAEYAELLRPLPLTRCPLTGREIDITIDGEDLDGLWWDYDRPVRPHRRWPTALFAFDGAMKLADEPTFSTVLASPGAEVPSIVPEIISEHDAVGVLSSVSVGRHLGYLVSYFSLHPDPAAPLVDEWGAKEHWRTSTMGDWVPSHRPDHEVDRDFELAPWMESGHLYWIEPGDPSRTLHRGIQDCPFLALRGRRTRSYVQYGRVWWSDETD